MTTASPHLSRDDARPGDREMIIGIAPDGGRFPIEKLDAHRRDVPHEAISVFVFREGRLLLQRRAAGKYHGGGLWANTCCSHPRWGEAPDACAGRRLREELGIAVPLSPLGTISYAVPVGDLHENEHVHCFAGAAPDGIDLSGHDRLEADAVAWRSLAEIEDDLREQPDVYAPWFAIYMREHRSLLARAEALARSD